MDILADNCHINLDMPHREKSTSEAIVDWSADVWSTATNPRVMREVGTGAKEQVSTTSGALETLGAVALGAGIRSVGAAIASAPTVSYLAGREVAILAISGPAAAADDVWAHMTSPFETANNTFEAARIVAGNEHPESDEAKAARLTLRAAGARATNALAMGIGSASGDLGVQTFRQGANIARSASMAIGRASFGEPLGLELQAVLGRLPQRAPVGAPGTIRGVLIAPQVAAAGEASIFHHEPPTVDSGRSNDFPNGRIADAPATRSRNQFQLGATRDVNGQITGINGPATLTVERDPLGQPVEISITGKKLELTQVPTPNNFLRDTTALAQEQDLPRDPASLIPGTDGRVSMPSDIMHLQRQPGTDLWTGTSKGVRRELRLESVSVKPDGVDIVHAGGVQREVFHADGSYTYDSKAGHRYTIADNGINADPKNWRITDWQNATGLRIKLTENSVDTIAGGKATQTTIDFSNGERWSSQPGSDRQWTITDKNGSQREFRGRIDFKPEDQSFSVPSIFGLGEVPGRAVPRTGKPYSLEITEESRSGSNGDFPLRHDKEFHSNGAFTETSSQTVNGRFEKHTNIFDEYGEPEHRDDQVNDLTRSFYGDDAHPYEIQLEGSDGRIIAQPDPAKLGGWTLHVADRAPDQPWLTVPANQFHEVSAQNIKVGDNQIEAQLADGKWITYAVKNGVFSRM